MTTPCAEAAEKAGVGQRVDARPVPAHDVLENIEIDPEATPELETTPQAKPAHKTGSNRSQGGENGLSGFVRRVKK